MNFKFLKSIFILIIFISAILLYLILIPKVKNDNYLIINTRNELKIATILYDSGLITNKYLFWFLLKFNNIFLNRHFKCGEYLIEKDSNLFSIINLLGKNKVFLRKIVVPEGFNKFKLYNLLQSKNGLIDRVSINEIEEGMVFPDTYFYTYGDSEKLLVSRMKKKMDIILEKEWQCRDKSIDSVIPNKYSALILASIVEKESSNYREIRDIASVYINRLKKGMRLQSDPSVVYGIINDGRKFDGRLYYKDLYILTPYNTYRLGNLPPSPISFPSKESIQSVLHPSNSDFIFFVSNGLGSHIFASSFEEHLENVKRERFMKKYRKLWNKSYVFKTLKIFIK